MAKNIVFLALIFLFVSCSKGSNGKVKLNEETVTDIDGNVYHTVTIGTQVWMVENLKTTKYRNGTSILNLPDNMQWGNNTTGAYCDYENNPSNAVVYGHLYNWYAVNNANNIAPVGWHVPSDAEWTTLTTYLGGESVAGGKLKEAGVVHWDTPNTGATNESGFTALPGGFRYSNMRFSGILFDGYWWSSTADYTGGSWFRNLRSVDTHVFRRSNYEIWGFSVRCIRDK